jgi:hypothetical protein
MLNGRRTVYILWEFKAFRSQLPKEVEDSVRTGGSNTIQGFRKRESSGEDS